MEKIKFASPKSAWETFHYLEGINRDVIKPHVRIIQESIKLMDVIRPVIVANINFIDGIKRRYIVDGQHLFEALINLDMEVPYLEIKIKDEYDLIKKIACLNASSKSWMLPDYVKSWSWLEGKEDYRKLLKTHNTTRLSINVLAMAFSLVDVRGGGADKNIIKRGDFTIENYSLGKKCADALVDVLANAPRGNRVATRCFVKAFSHWYHKNYTTYNAERFLKYMAKNRDTIRIFDDSNDEAVEFMNGFGGRSKIIDLTAAVG
jgi:hypothetical protein